VLTRRHGHPAASQLSTVRSLIECRLEKSRLLSEWTCGKGPGLLTFCTSSKDALLRAISSSWSLELKEFSAIVRTITSMSGSQRYCPAIGEVCDHRQSRMVGWKSG
jgi:hypothetical protein